MDKMRCARQSLSIGSPCERKMQDPQDIRNWRRRSEGVTTSGKLDAGDPARLAAIGVRHVINLALDEHPEALSEEGARFERLGIGYTHIPVPFDAPEAAHVEAFKAALEQCERPVHVHCIANYRVTAFFYLLDLAAGVDVAEAHSRMAQIWDPIASEAPETGPWKRLINCGRPPSAGR